MIRRLVITVALFYGFLTPGSPSAQDAENYEIVHNGTTYRMIDRGILERDSEWKFPFDADEKVIFVCWENPSDQYDAQMKMVKAAIENSWQASSRLRFEGWGACTTSSPGVHILIDDSGPHVEKFGRRLNGLKNGMVLNFTFQNWLPACQKGNRNTWIGEIAVHEFGHAIGFRHEQDRDDTPAYCKPMKTGPDPGTPPLTPWDPVSKMNYCYCAGDTKLSEFDKIAVAKVYGSQ